MVEAAVDIQLLNFTYAQAMQACFKDLNLRIEKGERFGLFGPNGSGKTTLMSCMTGLLHYQRGSISLLGKEIKKNHKHIKTFIGYVPQDLAFYQELTPLENLEYFGALSGLNKKQINIRSNELLEVLGLAGVKNKAVYKFSGGMKRKVNLAIGVIHNPALLFLDEPTVGVDVQTRHVIIDYLKELNKKGTTLIYTSHQLSEAQDLCNKIALLNEGKIIAHDEPEHLFSEHKTKDLETLFIKLTCRGKVESNA